MHMKRDWLLWLLMIRHRVFQLLCVLTLVTTVAISTVVVPTAFAGGPAPAQSPVILILGDSLSAASGIKVEYGWVNLLDKRLAAQGYSYRIVNASLNGLPTPGGLSRLPDLLAQHKPAIFILELGANDGLRGFPVKVINDNLTTLVQEGKQSGAKVLLVGVQLPLNYGPQYTEAFEKVFVDVSKASDVPLVPSLLGTVPLDKNLMQLDNLHPNAAGQPFLLDNVWPHLQPLLKK